MQKASAQLETPPAQEAKSESIAKKEYPKTESKEKAEYGKEPEKEPAKKEYEIGNPTPKREENKEPSKKEPKEEVEEKEEEEKEEKKPESNKKKVKYKMDGQEIEEEVDEQELINSYSGQKAIQKRFTELDQKTKAWQKEKQQTEEYVKNVDNYIGGIKNHFEGVLQSFSQGKVSENITEPIFDMVDKLGLDAQQLDKALFYHYIPVVAQFLDMDDNQRDAFFVKKENDWLKKKQNQVGERERQTQEYQKRIAEENSLKRQAGVSEEQFAELQSELVDKFGMDPKELNAQKVIQWAKEKPSYDRADQLVQTAGKGDVFKVAALLVEFPDVTDEEILNSLGYKEKRKEKLKEELAGKLDTKSAPKKTDRQKQLEEMALEKFKNYRR